MKDLKDALRAFEYQLEMGAFLKVSLKQMAPVHEAIAHFRAEIEARKRHGP